MRNVHAGEISIELHFGSRSTPRFVYNVRLSSGGLISYRVLSRTINKPKKNMLWQNTSYP